MRRTPGPLLAVLLAAALVIAGVRVSVAAFRLELDLPAAVDDDAEFLVTGHNDGATATLVVRIDDRTSSDYASRVNLERHVPPGRFEIRIAAGALVTGSGRTLDRRALRRAIVFAPDPAAQFRDVRLEIARAFRLPPQAHGWDFGPTDQALMGGFERVGPDDPRLSGQPSAIVRPSGDALTRDGLRGVTRFATAWPNGTWRVTLWIGDPGAWEWLPHALERRIRVNGTAFLEARHTADAWIDTVYLRGRAREAHRDGDPWTLFGRDAGHPITHLVTVTDGQLAVELAGAGIDATYVAGMLVEPKDDDTGSRALATHRAALFAGAWSWTPAAPAPASAPALALWPVRAEAIRVDAVAPASAQPARATAARGSLLAIDFLARSPVPLGAPRLTLSAPALAGSSLPTEMRWGHWRWRRSDGTGNLLVADAGHLRGDLAALSLDPALPRRINLVVTIPATAAPGRYRGRLTLAEDGHAAHGDIEIEVLPLTLPEPTAPVGVYLDDLPARTWFPEQAAALIAERRCSLRTLRRLGFRTVSPPLPLPTDAAAYLAALGRVREAGIDGPLLDYTSVKRLLASNPNRDDLGAVLAPLTRRAAASGQTLPAFAITDEPDVSPEALATLQETARVLRRALQNATLAAQLNHPAHRKLLRGVDVAYVNHGFGVDPDDLAAVRAAGATPWLYNLPDPRRAAGLHLWRSGAAGYLQWHARMPTADPFDPTDGREDDFLLLPPRLEACPDVPDLDARLLDLAAGVEDARWLTWLADRAETDAAARDALDHITQRIPTRWHAPADAAAIRDEIQAVARRLR